MRKIFLKLIILILAISIVIEGYNVIKPKNNIELKVIKNEKNLTNRNSTLAIQIQNDNDNGWHEAEDRTKWPDKSIYTWAGAECSDMEGIKSDYRNYLSFDSDTYTATINTKDTIYCTLYFTKGKPALDVLKENAGNTFNSTSAVFGLYRYKGTASQVTNNYICFGTNDMETCIKNPKTYMYRIIGITDNTSTNSNLSIPVNSLKIIKAKTYGNKYAWNSEYDVTWDGASINTSVLNTTFYNSISINNGINWQNLILKNHYWYIGDASSYNNTSETTTKSTTNNPIGLMYRSDYVNAYQNTSTDNWLFITNGWTDNEFEMEWTMTRVSRIFAYFIDSRGSYSTFWGDEYYYSNPTSIRPVFYLTSDVLLTGKGTTTDPFIITNKA